jgi:hypothetical protein
MANSIASQVEYHFDANLRASLRATMTDHIPIDHVWWHAAEKEQAIYRTSTRKCQRRITLESRILK